MHECERDDDFKRQETDIQRTEDRLYDVVDKKIPKIESCFKSSIGDAHTKREEGDKLLDRLKLDRKTFWGFFSAIMFIVLGTYGYVTYATEKEAAKIEGLETRVDSIEVVQGKAITILEGLTKTVDKMDKKLDKALEKGSGDDGG